MCHFRISGNALSGRLLPAGALAALRPARRRRRALRRPSASPLAARGTPPGLTRSRSRSGYRPPLLRLCGAPPRGRALWPSRVAVLGRARAVAASGSPSPRLGPLRRACARPPRSSGPLRAALRPWPLWSPSRRPGLPGGRPGLCLGLPAGCGPLRRALPGSRLVLGRGWRAAPPRAGALGPLRGPRGAAFRAPARWGSRPCLCSRKHRAADSRPGVSPLGDSGQGQGERARGPALTAAPSVDMGNYGSPASCGLPSCILGLTSRPLPWYDVCTVVVVPSQQHSDYTRPPWAWSSRPCGVLPPPREGGFFASSKYIQGQWLPWPLPP